MEHLGLEVRIRKESGKQGCKRVRNSGFIPAVVYGLGENPVSVEVAFKDFEKARKAGGEHSVIDLKIRGGGSGDDETIPVIVRDEHFHPARGSLMHVDFYRVSLTQEITSQVPLETFGEPAGLKFGGILEHNLRELEVKCLPDALPENIEIDVSALEIGDSIHVKDIPPPEGVEILDEPDMIVVAVIPPRVEEEVVEEVEEAPEPERVGEEKEAEEGEEGGEKEKE